jgi:hypothetical protein
MPAESDFGRSLVGLLIALALLGGLGAAALVSQASNGSSQSRQPTAPTTINASPSKAATDIQVAAVMTCRSNYGAVVAAVSYYEALNGKPPAEMAQLAPIIRQSVSSTHFSITINRAQPGQVEVAAGGHQAAPGDGNCAYAG